MLNCQCIQVYSPWLANRRAANSAGSRRSRRVMETRTRDYEGNVEKRTRPIGELHQVSHGSIPKAGTWNKEKEMPGEVHCEKLWDGSCGICACNKDGRIDHFIDSLDDTHQKVKFIEYLHQSNYVFDAATQKFDDEMTLNGENALLHKGNESNAVLEGAEHQKQFTILISSMSALLTVLSGVYFFHIVRGNYFSVSIISAIYFVVSFIESTHFSKSKSRCFLKMV